MLDRYPRWVSYTFVFSYVGAGSLAPYLLLLLIAVTEAVGSVAPGVSTFASTFLGALGGGLAAALVAVGIHRRDARLARELQEESYVEDRSRQDKAQKAALDLQSRAHEEAREQARTAEVAQLAVQLGRILHDWNLKTCLTFKLEGTDVIERDDGGRSQFKAFTDCALKIRIWTRKDSGVHDELRGVLNILNSNIFAKGLGALPWNAGPAAEQDQEKFASAVRTYLRMTEEHVFDWPVVGDKKFAQRLARDRNMIDGAQKRLNPSPAQWDGLPPEIQ